MDEVIRAKLALEKEADKLCCMINKVRECGKCKAPKCHEHVAELFIIGGLGYGVVCDTCRKIILFEI